MVLKIQQSLTRRERQIMDILLAGGPATASQVQAAMANAPGYSAVRATLRIMEEKGYLRHHQQGASYVYSPKTPPRQAMRTALRHLLDTFFGGSPEQAVAALLDSKPGAEELERIAAMIDRARSEGR